MGMKYEIVEEVDKLDKRKEFWINSTDGYIARFKKRVDAQAFLSVIRRYRSSMPPREAELKVLRHLAKNDIFPIGLSHMIRKEIKV